VPIVYVKLIGEGTTVWRPVDAERVSSDVFRLSSGVVEPGEQWEFQPSSLVRCVPHIFASGESGLVAVQAHVA